MKVSAQQLSAHLAKTLLPIYLISGDEPLQCEEVRQKILESAAGRGYTERTTLHVDSHFQWSQLIQATKNLSLFANKQVIECRMPKARPGKEGAQALTEYAKRVPQNTLLLLITERLDASQQRAKWVTSLDLAGAIISVWPIATRELPQWIQISAKSLGLTLTHDAVLLLADSTEGNLLATKQELEKLAISYGGAPITIEHIQEVISNQARFDVFDLVDTLLGTSPERTLTIIDRLKGEGVEPILIVWALAREFRQLASMARGKQQGSPVEALLKQNRVWPKRIPIVKASLQRFDVLFWWTQIQSLAWIDRIIKGTEVGNSWGELKNLCIKFCEASSKEPRVC